MPQQRWQIAPARPELAAQLATQLDLSPLLAQVLINRGIETPAAAQGFLDPEQLQLPSPLDEFPHLTLSLEILGKAIEDHQPIAICGDYDADGMTSTALLLRALRFLGAEVDYAIPSRMSEGYGINERIVEEFYAEGVGVILTVDNGIAAHQPIARARELGLTVIVTDHHDIPEILPAANAILNPKLLPETSPYWGIAGVGAAYILAICLAQSLGKTQDLTAPLLELFTLGTIADLAPLTGVNRRWVRRGLRLLPRSRILGVQALIQVAGLGDQDTALKPEDIGFKLGPRINAVGRISDPQIVIELLTTDDVGVALERAMQCEQINQRRRELCAQIEQEAIAWCEAEQRGGSVDLQRDRLLLVIQPNWHHGVIGIVASRLVERYGVPVFIGTYEDGEQKVVRGSARGIPEFHVFEALQSCDDLMEKYGGHRAAGGFTFAAKRLRQVKARLVNYANQQLQLSHLQPLVTIDVEAYLANFYLDFYKAIDRLHPCGIQNADPVFWSANVRLLEQKAVGRNQDHLKLVLAQTAADGQEHILKAIAWRWGEYCPLPERLDIAYKLRLNEWQGNRSIELEIVGVRLPSVQLHSHPKSGGSPQAVVVQETIPTIPKDAAAQEILTPSELAQETVAQTATAQDPTAQGTPSQSVAFSDAIDQNTLAQDAAIQETLAEDASDAAPNAKTPSRPRSSPSLPFEKSQPRHQPAPRSTPLAVLKEPIPVQASFSAVQPRPTEDVSEEASTPQMWKQRVDFFYSRRRYSASISAKADARELSIRNAEGQMLVVLLPERQGFLCQPNELPLAVDLAEPYYFNLVRAGLGALELRQTNRLLLEKDELLTEKDGQIETLTRQVALLEEKLNQLDNSQKQQFQQLQQDLKQQESEIQTQEAHIAALQSQLPRQVSLDPQTIRQQVRQAVGDKIWYCLSKPSQKDLYNAYKHQALIAADGEDNPLADYSEAGLRLGFVVEREVLQPFFADLYRFVLEQGITELGGVALGPQGKYTLGMLPPLLAESWKTLRDGVLKQASRPAKPYSTHKSTALGRADRERLAAFLAQWDHPGAAWMAAPGGAAASWIDQISRLRNLAAHAESPLLPWHYALLRDRVLGSTEQPGLIQKMYGPPA